MKYRLRKPELVPALVTLAAVALTFYLALWQLQRLEEKTQLIADIDRAQSLPPQELASFPEDQLKKLEWRNVRIHGKLLHDKELYATPRYLNGKLGYAVLTPLAFTTPTGTHYVLVNRGWVSPENKPPEQRSEGNPAGEVIVEGALRNPLPKKYFTPENQPARNLWFWYDLPAMSAELHLPLLPVMVDATATRLATGETLHAAPSPFPIEINIRNDHKGYAITWLLIGLGAIGVFLAYHLEPESQSRKRRV